MSGIDATDRKSLTSTIHQIAEIDDDIDTMAELVDKIGKTIDRPTVNLTVIFSIIGPLITILVLTGIVIMCYFRPQAIEMNIFSRLRGRNYSDMSDVDINSEEDDAQSTTTEITQTSILCKSVKYPM